MSALPQRARHGAQVAAAAYRLRRYLLHGPASLRDGPERGGVAGVLGSDAHPLYIYPEITGYYLHWLAGLPPSGDDRVRQQRARAAMDWLDRHVAAGGLPPTRILTRPGDPDWRCGARFCFDVAMLAGGVAAATEAGLAAASPRVLDALARELSGFARPDGLRAALAGSPLPDTWSTTPGPHLLKAAARIRRFARLHANTPALDQAVAATLATHSPRIGLLHALPLHPFLYGVEGALQAGCMPRRELARLLAAVLSLRAPEGGLPEHAGVSSRTRSDVQAQALRLALLLDVPHGGGATRDALAMELAARVRRDGSLGFAPDAPAHQSNIWCAIFAEQALRWHDDGYRAAWPACAEALA